MVMGGSPILSFLSWMGPMKSGCDAIGGLRQELLCLTRVYDVYLFVAVKDACKVPLQSAPE